MLLLIWVQIASRRHKHDSEYLLRNSAANLRLVLMWWQVANSSNPLHHFPFNSQCMALRTVQFFTGWLIIETLHFFDANLFMGSPPRLPWNFIFGFLRTVHHIKTHCSLQNSICLAGKNVGTCNAFWNNWVGRGGRCPVRQSQGFPSKNVGARMDLSGE